LRFEFSSAFKISVFTELIDILLNLGRSGTDGFRACSGEWGFGVNRPSGGVGA
jgi:hypothetical protein